MMRYFIRHQLSLSCVTELASSQAKIFELTSILEKLYQCSLANHTTGPDSAFEVRDWNDMYLYRIGVCILIRRGMRKDEYA